MEMQTATMAPPIQALHTEAETSISSPPPSELAEVTANQPSMKRTASAPKLSESKSLANETKDLLGRAGVTGVARRCAHYTPSLKELSTTSFSDYIRGEVLGVPLPGYEFLYVYDDAKKEGGPPSCSTPPLCQEASQAVTVVPASKQISPVKSCWKIAWYWWLQSPEKYTPTGLKIMSLSIGVPSSERNIKEPILALKRLAFL